MPLLVATVFLWITFTFSIVEKLMDWKGSVAFYQQHFKGTFVASIIPISLVLVVLLELISVLFMSVGLYQLIMLDLNETLFFGLVLVAFTLLVLLIGQRIAKDYPGAMSLGVYLVVTLIGLIFIH
ncbi:MAG: DoxX family protein [Flavobacteriaceae bacterium]|nr:MAG: DoxX family protein [Flavobacteriaceae bacterium]